MMVVLRRVWGACTRASVERRRFAEARAVAQRTFRAAYPERTLIVDMCTPHHMDEAMCVVQLCEEGPTIPPRRSFWLVSREGDCCELSIEDASRLRPLAAWR